MTFIPLTEWRELFLTVIQIEFSVPGIAQPGIQQIGVLLTNGEREFVFKRVNLQVIPEDVAVD